MTFINYHQSLSEVISLSEIHSILVLIPLFLAA